MRQALSAAAWIALGQAGTDDRQTRIELTAAALLVGRMGTKFEGLDAPGLARDALAALEADSRSAQAVRAALVPVCEALDELLKRVPLRDLRAAQAFTESELIRRFRPASN